MIGMTTKAVIPCIVVVLFLISAAWGQSCSPSCTDKQFCGVNSTGQAACIECDLSCNGCTGEGNTNCKLCANSYYNDSGTCRGCDEACSFCYGGSRTQCTNCKAGNQLIGTTCQACAVDRYGVNCTGECHCLDQTKCDKTNGRCSDWNCFWGYTEPPLCQTVCSGKFGSNCVYDCHCPENDTCNPRNGACGSNKCAEDYGGSGCQVELPKLRLPPTVIDEECGNVTVSWNAWSKDTVEKDIGEGPIAQYRLYYKHSNDSTWVLVKTVVHNIRTSKYSEALTGLSITLKYQFRVDVVRQDDDKLMMDVAQGYSTDPVTLKCPETTTSTTTTVTPPPPQPDTFFQDFQVNLLADNTVNVSWSLIGNNTGITIDNVTLMYGILQLEDCSSFLDPNYTEIPVLSISNWISPGLSPWSRYKVKVIVKTSYNLTVIKTEESKEIQTTESDPTGPVTNLQVLSITSKSARAIWEEPQCGKKGGVLTQYDLLYLNLNETGAKQTGGSTTTRSYDLGSLKPYTTYQLQARYRNKLGRGPLSQEVLFTTLEAAPSAPTITSLTPGVKEMVVQVSLPTVQNGVVREYMVFYSLNSGFTGQEQKSSVSTSVTITGLDPYTKYYFKAQARTTPGLWGDFSETKNEMTQEDIPSAPASLLLISRNESCLGITWSAPVTPNGNIAQYKIHYTDIILDQKSSGIIVDSSVSSYTICNLKPYRQYLVEISASTSKGFGPTTLVINTTEIGTPPTPPVPTFINATSNSIAILINPMVITTGPLVAYKLYVHDLSDSSASAPGYLAANFPAENITSSTGFILGDGNTYGDGVNKALVLNHKYDIYLEIESSLDGITKTNRVKMATIATSLKTTTTPLPVVVAPSSSSNTGIIVAIVVIILLLIIALVIIGIILWYRRRQSMGRYTYQPYIDDKEQYKLEVVVDDYDPHKYWNTIYSHRESRYIVAGRELLPNEPLISNGTLVEQIGSPPLSFSQEFHDLPHGQLSAWSSAALRKNADKNRFPHLLPYDHSRVILKHDTHANGDYINANFIKGFKNSQAYIAAQSPFNDHTVLDFWRMIYQTDVKIVVMITNVIEDRIVKCTQYWPDPEQGKVKYGGFFLELVDIKYFADYIIRTIKVKEKQIPNHKFVHLFEFCSWPDHGVPDDPIPLLEMRNKVCEYRGNDTSPLLVHCGTGVSRTGTLIAIDSLLQQYEADGRISVFSCVRRLRKDRVAMVRTVKQYVFIYEAIFEARVAGDTRAGADLRSFYRTLTKRNPNTNHTYLRDQFKCLQRYTRKVPTKHCLTALNPVNMEKNRFPDVIPSDTFRPVLETLGILGRTDYINAVLIDGHKQRNHFIATQTPLHTTITDFWKLVYDYDVSTIVMMENYKHEDDTCAQYWPEKRATKYEPFFIDNTEVYQKDNVTIRHFKVTNMQFPRTPPREIRHFQFNAWDDPEFTPKSKTMLLDLIELVNEWQMEANENQQPIVVHCKDGATHSGLFCASATICEAMQEDGNVDLFHMVKHMKRRRPQIIDMIDQYRFCYKLLWDYMNLRMEGGTLTNMMNHKSSDPLYVGSLSLPSYASHLEYI